MTIEDAKFHRKAVVTGAAGGLGRAMALGLLDAGYSVMLVDQDAMRIVETLALADARGVGARAFGFDADLTTADATTSIMDAAQALLGGIDILVNNAGLGPGLISKDYFANPPAFDSLPDALVRKFFEVNGITPLLLAMHAARRMRQQNWGRIVNVTTSLDSMMRRGFAPYGGTKASLESHSAIMARDLEGSGIMVNVLVPGGAADTAMIPQESGFDRTQLIRPEAMVAPLLWLLADVPDAPHEQRVLAAGWTPEAATNDHPSVAPIGWPDTGSRAILPPISQ